jgi:hypothetical protein
MHNFFSVFSLIFKIYKAYEITLLRAHIRPPNNAWEPE